MNGIRSFRCARVVVSATLVVRVRWGARGCILSSTRIDQGRWSVRPSNRSIVVGEVRGRSTVVGGVGSRIRRKRRTMERGVGRGRARRGPEPEEEPESAGFDSIARVPVGLLLWGLPRGGHSVGLGGLVVFPSLGHVGGFGALGTRGERNLM